MERLIKKESQVCNVAQNEFRRIVRNRNRILGNENYALLQSGLLSCDLGGSRFNYPMGNWLKAFDARKLEVFAHQHLVRITGDQVLLFNDQTERLQYLPVQNLPSGKELWVERLSLLTCPITLIEEWKVAFSLLDELDEHDRLEWENWNPRVTWEEWDEYDRMMNQLEGERGWRDELHHHELMEHEHDECYSSPEWMMLL